MKIRKVMVCSKGNGQNSSSCSDDAHRPCLSRHAVHTTNNTRCSHRTQVVVEDRIKVGSFYEIDTSKLAPETPNQLKSIRVVMVNEKSPLKISLRFPSIYSLRTHLKEGSGRNPDGKKLPALDEKYVMGSGHAAKVLSRRIPSQELADQRNSWGFWVGPSMAVEGSSIDRGRPVNRTGVRILVPKKGRCLSELLDTGMVRWGKRRKVRFLRRHEEAILNNGSSNNDVKQGRDKEEEEEMKKNDEEEEEEENREEAIMEESDDPDDDVDDKTVVMESSIRVTRSKMRKRMRQGSTPKKKSKKPKLEEKQKQIQVYQSRKKTVKSCIDRWSADRYKLAEMNMLKILKAKGAVFGNPILRPALRAEARKQIGDTGLLDHLLKHMAGKVAPGGVERFRRRHNADGAMEYWLESADLVNVRKEAGVQDPYWTPPPGWKPGDNPTMDPACAGELRELKEELAEMRREMKLALASKKQCDNQIIVSPPLEPCEHLEGSSSMLSKEKVYAELVRKKAIVEEQLVKIKESLSDMEETMKKLKSREEDSGRRAAAAAILPNLNSVSEEERKVEESKESGEKEGKIEERVKSGFRVWKAEGSFVWPDMVSVSSPSPGQAVVPTLTPPTITSSSSTPQILPPLTITSSPLTLAQPLRYYGPSPPLKPVAHRGAIPINALTAPTSTSTSARP